MSGQVAVVVGFLTGDLSLIWNTDVVHESKSINLLWCIMKKLITGQTGKPVLILVSLES